MGQALDRLRLACQGSENTMPFILEAVHAYATLGEIIDVMKRSIWHLPGTNLDINPDFGSPENTLVQGTVMMIWR